MDDGMTEMEARKKIKDLFGSKSYVEYDSKMTALKCWVYRVSERGFISGMWGGRSWEDAFSEMTKQLKERAA